MDQLTRKEFKEICRVCRDAPIRSLTSESFREVLAERLAGKWAVLSSKIADFTDEQANTLREEVEHHFVPVDVAIGVQDVGNPVLASADRLDARAEIVPAGAVAVLPSIARVEYHIGSVDFFDVTTNTDPGSVALSSGKASLITSALAVGNHAIVASYNGDSTFLPSLDKLTQAVHYTFRGFLGPLKQVVRHRSEELQMAFDIELTLDLLKIVACEPSRSPGGAERRIQSISGAHEAPLSQWAATS